MNFERIFDGGYKVKKICEKINWSILNFAFWLEIILSYFLPFKITENDQYRVGFPIPFLFVNATGIRTSPFLSMHFNPIGLIVNGMIVYLIIMFIRNIFQKRRL